MKKMKTKEIEEKLNKAVSHAVPDVKDAILAKCNSTETNYVQMNMAAKRQKRHRRAVWSRILVAAAAVLLLLNIGFMGLRSFDKQVYTTIDIDVNPSIELKINSSDRVISVTALNDDAIKIIDGMDLTGAKTKVAINAIMGSMLSHGYLSEDTRTVLVSVDSSNKDNAVKVKEEIAGDVGAILNTYSVQAAVVSQTMTINDSAVTSIADEYGISQGKAEFVQKIVTASPEYDPAILSEMSVTELDTILDEIGANENVVELVTTGDGDIIIVDNTTTINELLADNSNQDIENDDLANEDGTDSSDGENMLMTASNGETSDDNSLDNGTDENDAASSNSASDNSASDNSASANSLSDNSASSNSASNNSASFNSASQNQGTEKNSDKDDKNGSSSTGTSQNSSNNGTNSGTNNSNNTGTTSDSTSDKKGDKDSNKESPNGDSSNSGPRDGNDETLKQDEQDLDECTNNG